MGLDKTTIRRLALDVKYILNNEQLLKKENIYYKHDENNLLKGYALIIGNKTTPYSYGYYFFEFNFPENYPFDPPKVKYLTNDGKMRFNPNFYTNGKVCLSVLNTWEGEGWTSCQTIYSILMILSSTLNDNPLLNEPGVNSNDRNIKDYNLLISYKAIEYSIIKQYYMMYNISDCSDSNNKNNYFNIISLFKNIINETLIINFEDIKKKIYKFDKKYTNVNISMYSLKYELDFYNLEKNLNQLYDNLLKNNHNKLELNKIDFNKIDLK